MKIKIPVGPKPSSGHCAHGAHTIRHIHTCKKKTKQNFKIK